MSKYIELTTVYCETLSAKALINTSAIACVIKSGTYEKSMLKTYVYTIDGKKYDVAEDYDTIKDQLQNNFQL